MRKIIVDKELLYKLYIKENRTRLEISKLFNISENQVKYIISKLNLSKTRSLFSKNIGKSQIGKSKSSVTKERISKSKKGTKAWNKGLTKETDSRIKCNVGINLGKKRTKEQRDFISKRTKEGMNNDVVRNKIIESNKNRVYTKEQRELRSKITRNLWCDVEYAERCSNPRFGNKSVYKGIKFQSDSEMIFAKKCDELGIKWKYHIGCFKYLLRRDNKYHNYFPDFYLEDYDIYIEIKYRKNYLYGCDDELEDKLDGMNVLGLKCLLLDRRDFKNLISILNNAGIG